jgi:nucleoid-associated protein YgaU
MKRLMITFLALAVLLPSLALGANKDRMTYDQYLVELEGYQQREMVANQELTAVNQEIARLQAELASTQGQIDSSWDQIYSALGTDRRGLENYLKNVENLRDDFARYAQMDLDEMRRNGDGIYRGIQQYENFSQSRMALYPDAEAWLREIATYKEMMENKIVDMPLEYLSETNFPTSYQVVRGDCLWNIAKKPFVYNDPFKWTWIYDSNRDQIDDPDLIFPNQVFSIPRDRMMRQNRLPLEDIKMRYTVVPGDFLARIAGYPQVYSNPALWPLIYEANQDQITDPNLINPGQILDVPYER